MISREYEIPLIDGVAVIIFDTAEAYDAEGMRIKEGHPLWEVAQRRICEALEPYGGKVPVYNIEIPGGVYGAAPPKTRKIEG